MTDAFITDNLVFITGIATAIAGVLGSGLVGLSALAALAVREKRHLRDAAGPAKETVRRFPTVAMAVRRRMTPD